MSEQFLNQAGSNESAAEPHPIQAILRFLRAVYHRKGLVVLALAVSCLLGGFYYATKTPLYESTASLLVLQSGDAWSTEMAGARQTRDYMDTYKNMLSSEVVMEAAVKTLPPEHREWLKGIPSEKWATALQANLSVSTGRNATVLNVAYRSENPRTAAACVDCIISAYMDFMHKLHQNTAAELQEILTKEMANLDAQMREKQQQIILLRRQAKQWGASKENQGVDVALKQVSSLHETWIEAHKARLDAQSQQLAVEQAIRSGEDLVEFALAMSSEMGGERFLQRLGISPPDAYTNARMNQQITEDHAKLQSALQVYGPAHHKVREIQERIRTAEHMLQNQYQIRTTQLHQLGNGELAPLLLSTVGQNLNQAIARENLVSASLEEAKNSAAALDGARAQLDIQELDWTRLQRTYDIVLERLKGISLDETGGTVRTRVLNPPAVPTVPVEPRKDIIALLSILLGLGTGCGIVYLLDLLDDRFRSPEELQAHLRLPVLAMVRQMDATEGTGIESVQTYARPNATEAEAFRTLRTALSLSENNIQRLVVSSSEPGDGKSTIISNLAVSYAQSGKRTLLIDADMRRPGLTTQLALKGQLGLSSVLRSSEPVAQAAVANLHASLAPNLDVLPSGPRPINPSELLVSDRFSELLAWAETHYDQILIDSPPALVSDTAIIGRLVDGVLLAVRPEKNRRRTVIRAVESFAILGIRVAGVAINRINPEKGKGYGYGYGYGYDYSGYSYGYGYGYGYDYDADPDDAHSDGDVSVDEPAEAPPTIARRAA